MSTNPTQPTQLDHVIILLPYADLKSPPNWITSNFSLSPGGRHSDSKTENRLVIFQDGTYLELIAFINDDPAKRKGHWWDKPNGIVDFACTTSGDFAYEDLQQRLRDSGSGISYAAPQEGGRRMPDGQELEWKVTFPLGAERGEVPFWCHDVTPRERRVPVHNGKTEHPCGAVGMAGITIKIDSAKHGKISKSMAAITETSPDSSSRFAVGAPIAKAGSAGDWVHVAELDPAEGVASMLELTLRTPGHDKQKPFRQDVGDGSVCISFDNSE
ncbi:hypothetical protein LTR62_002144 [Meristemomyces frigidus]|uniref:Glyoxalase-like domain-containing protein n=1 Tax=Meristemomyces frigidus TaxID=1508187 RepID=A0AAN7YKS4_9PEZI|nr:hypothetical protein LTR62_002144 [Meristemomyces frigidus]